MIKRSLIELLFSAASIERWNDHPRPIQFTELAKQAHKMVIAYVIAKYESEKTEASVNWIGLIEGGIFEFLHRVVITDIKPPIFHKLMENDEQRRRLNDWVLCRLSRDLDCLPHQLIDRFRRYFDDNSHLRKEKSILRAAHYLATKWEFNFIYDWSRPLFHIERTRREIDQQIEEHRDLMAVDVMLREVDLPDNQKGIYGFISLVGQLRFQKRWAQTPRIPQTSVLGHLLFVAILSYLISMEVGACDRRRYNAFFGGLFHDLPEVLTRDIISPVKNSVEGLDEMIKNIEMQAIRENIFPLLPESWQDELLYFVKDEFENKIWPSDRKEPLLLKGRDIPEKYNYEKWNPIDGRIIEMSDKLSAYIEASQSIRLGIKSPALEEGMRRIYDRFGRTPICGYPAGQLFDLFR